GVSGTNTFSVDTSAPSISYAYGTPTDGEYKNSTSASVLIDSGDNNTTHSVVNDWNNSLVSWWRMEDNAGNKTVTDYMGNNNGTSVQNTSALTTTGKLGKAMTFDGSSDYVETTLNVAGQTGLTVAGWFYQTDSDYTTPIGTYTDPTDMAFDLDLGGPTKKIQFNLKGENGSRSDLDTADNAYSINQWVHVVATWNGATMRIYVDGSEVANKAYSDSSIEQTVSSPVVLGAYRSGSYQSYGGSIDDVQIYNRALSADEIKSLYDASANQYSQTFTGLSNGSSYTFKSYAQDLAGNVTASDTNTFSVDTVFPTTGDNFTHNDSWQTSNQTITLTPTDASPSSGFAYTKYCVDTTNTCVVASGTAYGSAVPIATEGTSYFRYASADNAGNVQTTVSKTVKIDTISPSTVADGGGYSFGTESADAVSVSLICADSNGAGCLATYYCTSFTNDCTPGVNGTTFGVYTTPQTISTAGTSYIRYFSTDAVNNSETPIKSQTIIINSTQAWMTPWRYRKQITIDHTKVGNGTENEANFPVLISLTGLTNVNANGTDIRFTQSNGTTQLAREVESYSAGTLTAWVKIPTLSHTADTVIYMYYGNSSATEPVASSTYGSQNVWDANYKGVWHLKEATGVDNADSTSNGNTGTPINGPIQTAGQVDGSLSFDGNNDYVNVPISSTFTNSLTASAWVYLDTTSANYDLIVGKTDFSSIAPWEFRFLGASNRLSLGANIGDSWGEKCTIDSGDALSNNQWYRVVVTYDGSYIIFYKNGVAVKQCSQTGNFYSSPVSIKIGGYTSQNLSGSLDEVQVSDTAHTAGWIKTEYNNQNAPATFATVTSSEAYDIIAPTTTADAGSYTFGNVSGASASVTLSCADNAGGTGCAT
ncbi:MAG: DUF2341 domain-containing protein, partial [Candidatus Staskawiczbacteria bacterium]|nr:DUF2341 domain-containing protein [Candidatus Staskawiczbacteria bacterium]